MGQEISQQNKCNTSRRQQQPFPPNQRQQPQQLQQKQKQNFHQYQDNTSQQQNYQSTQFNNSSNFSLPQDRHYKPHKELIYTSSSLSNASSTDDEYYRQRQKYNLAKQKYEKTKISKTQLGSRKSLDSHSSASDYQSSAFETAEELYRDLKGNHHRKSSQSTDSGIYYSSCYCTPTRFSSAASVASGGATSVVSSKSNKSVQKQKEYLDHQLYIKSYLDILEEDQKAKAQYKVAKPGGIRNYTPKILSEVTLSTSAPEPSNGFSKQKSKIKEDPWI
ncbi:hypothetical protein DOY81_003221 [Sarcophaga bullata]|nr:hypothetical protein DOY81_003221 [Sarcophaga bullata]